MTELAYKISGVSGIAALDPMRHRSIRKGCPGMAYRPNQIALTLILFPHFVHAQEQTDIKQFALDFIEAEKAAWERGELDALRALEHENVVYQNINGRVFRGWGRA